MAVNIVHLVYIPFTGVGLVGFKSQEWFKRRVEIFKEFTLKSLQNQEYKGFTLWLSFRPEEYENPLIEDISKAIEKAGLRAILTFDGLMYWDDKFTKGLIPRIKNIGRIVRQAYRERSLDRLGDLRFLFRNKNKDLAQRVQKSINSLHEQIPLETAHYVYVTRIDSDDMFHRETIKEIQTKLPHPGAIVCGSGFVYNSDTGEMAEWTPKTNPPFHTIMFPREEFIDGERYVQFFRTFKSHEDIPRVFSTTRLKDGMYCVTIHNAHISTLWDHPFRGKAVDGDRIKDFK